MTLLRILVLGVEAMVALALVRRLLGPGTALTTARWPLGLALFAGTVSLGGALSHGMEWRSTGGITLSHLAVLAAMSGILLAAGRPAGQPGEPPAPRADGLEAPAWLDRLLAGALGLAIALLLAGAVLHLLHNPNGGYDGWGMWNGKADVLAQDPGSLPELIGNLSRQGHPDYPLLLPLVLAAGFECSGPRALPVPMAVAAAFGVATFALLFLSLRSLKGWRFAALGLLCAVGCLELPMYAFHQYADVPLALYFLAAVAVIVDGLRRRPDPGPFALAGAMLGCAAWTKNEGNLMVLAVLLAAVPTLARRGGLRAAAPLLAAMALGAAPFLALTVGFKALIPQANDLVEAWHGGTLRHLADPARYLDVSYFGWKLLCRWGRGIGVPLVIAFFVFAPDRRLPHPDGLAARWLAGALAIVVSGYFLVFVTTPLDLGFHLKTAMDRLVCQVWPALLFVALLTRRDDLFLRLPGVAPPAAERSTVTGTERGDPATVGR